MLPTGTGRVSATWRTPASCTERSWRSSLRWRSHWHWRWHSDRWHPDDSWLLLLLRHRYRTGCSTSELTHYRPPLALRRADPKPGERYVRTIPHSSSMGPTVRSHPSVLSQGNRLRAP